jgi:hypothetical protein
MGNQLTIEEKEALKGLLVQAINRCHCRIVEAGQKGSCSQSSMDDLVMRHGLLNQILVKVTDGLPKR